MSPHPSARFGRSGILRRVVTESMLKNRTWAIALTLRGYSGMTKVFDPPEILPLLTALILPVDYLILASTEYNRVTKVFATL
jgi:hypothetical protein